jgi:hypothetical protein
VVKSLWWGKIRSRGVLMRVEATWSKPKTMLPALKVRWNMVKSSSGDSHDIGLGDLEFEAGKLVRF